MAIGFRTRLHEPDVNAAFVVANLLALVGHGTIDGVEVKFKVGAGIVRDRELPAAELVNVAPSGRCRELVLQIFTLKVERYALPAGMHVRVAEMQGADHDAQVKP